MSHRGWATDANDFCVSRITTAGDEYVALLPKIIISWASKDLSLFTPASAPVLPTASGSDAATSSARSTSTQTKATATHKHVTPQRSSQSNPTPLHEGGLSTGAKAGIGVGVAVVAVILVIVGFLLWRKRKRRATPISSPQRTYVDDKSALPGHGSAVEAPAAEREPQELAGGQELQQVAVHPKRTGIGGGTHELQ